MVSGSFLPMELTRSDRLEVGTPRNAAVLGARIGGKRPRRRAEL
jgi:hypothetical protein